MNNRYDFFTELYELYVHNKPHSDSLLVRHVKIDPVYTTPDLRLELNEILRSYSIIEIAAVMNLIGEIPIDARKNMLSFLGRENIIQYFQKEFSLPLLQSLYNRITITNKQHQSDYKYSEVMPIFLKFLSLHDDFENDEQIRMFKENTFEASFNLDNLIFGDLKNGLTFGKSDASNVLLNRIHGYYKYLYFIREFQGLYVSAKRFSEIELVLKQYSVFLFNDIGVSFNKIVEHSVLVSIKAARISKAIYDDAGYGRESEYVKNLLQSIVTILEEFVLSCRNIGDYESEFILDLEDVFV